MFIEMNGKWHAVWFTDPDYISFHGEQMHQTRCGFWKIRVSYKDFPPNAPTCKRCEKLVAKDEAR